MFLRLSSLFLLIAVTFACPDGGLVWNSNCYIFNATEEGFAKAELICVQQGGHLVSIHDAFTNAVIGQSAPDYFHQSSITNFWIGLNNLNDGTTWQWTDGMSVDFQDWARGQPNNGSNRNCAVLNMNTQMWSSETCIQPRPFVCAIGGGATGGPGQTTAQPLSTTTSGSGGVIPTSPTSNSTCSQGWNYVASTNAYYCAGDISQDWNSAEAYCVSLGGHLASVHSDEEAMLVDGYSYFLNSEDYAFAGLTSTDNGQTWQWTDGSPTDYLPWDSFQPNGGNCAFLGDDNDFTTPPLLVKIPCSGEGDEGFTVCKRTS